MIEGLSDKQVEVVRHAVTERTCMFAGGAIRSGKTWSSSIGWSIWLLNEGMKNDHALLSYSLEAAMRNVGWNLIKMLKSLGASASLTRDLGTRIVIRYKGLETNVWIIGASDERSLKRLQGATLKSLFADEIVLIRESFFNVAWGRLSVAGSKVWATYNPESPLHWFKRKVLDRVEDYDGVELPFYMNDNPTLVDEVIERYDTSFVGHYYRRMIQGEWCGASGQIWPRYYKIEEEIKNPRIVFSLDWGQSGVFAALCFHSKGERANVVAELYHDARELTPLTQEELKVMFTAWAKEQGGLQPGIQTVLWLDPATPVEFKRALRQEGFVVRNADNSVLEGIGVTGARLASKQVQIGDCPSLIDEINAYQWDEKKAEIGEDAPIKMNDHACDALRYYCYSTGKAYRMIEPTSVNHVFRTGKPLYALN